MDLRTRTVTWLVTGLILACPAFAEKAVQHRENRVKQADTNGDGKISREEFKAAFPQAPEGVFDRRDRNHDGFLSKADRPNTDAAPHKGRKPNFAEFLKKADADGDQKVTYEELKAVAPKITRERFASFDTNKDGVLTPADRKKHGPRPEGQALLTKADKDKNGEVTLEELKAAFPDMTQEKFERLDRNADGVLSPADAPEGPASDRKMALIAKADTDKNGKVTLEELKAADPEITKGNYQLLDRNGDGVLTKEDRPKGSGAKHLPFAKADADKDGKLTLEELKKVAPEMNEEKFKALDRNGDGVLTKEDRPEGGKGRGDKRELLLKADADGNHEVTFEELKKVAPEFSREKFDHLDRNGDGLLTRDDTSAGL